jgi:hypothetical protein
MILSGRKERMMAENKSSSFEEKFDKKMKHFEKRLDEIGEKVEQRGEEFGRRVEEKAKSIHKDFAGKGHNGHGLFWGIVLIALGLLWLGNNLGWFYYDIPWFPVVMIAVGIYMILRYRESEKTGEHEKSESET